MDTPWKEVLALCAALVAAGGGFFSLDRKKRELRERNDYLEREREVSDLRDERERDCQAALYAVSLERVKDLHELIHDQIHSQNAHTTAINELTHEIRLMKSGRG